VTDVDAVTLPWTDLLDPDAAQLEAEWPGELYDLARAQLLAPARHGDEPRPKIDSHGNYVLAVFVVPVAVPADDRVFHQEIDLLVSPERILSVRKTPDRAPGSTVVDQPYDPTDVREALLAAGRDVRPGTIAYHVADDVAEAFLDLIDDVHGEIDQLEDEVEGASDEHVRTRISELRHDLLHIRRTLAPTRDAVRRIVDGRVDAPDDSTFPHELELQFGDVFDKLLRASEGLESARDLIGGVRDYHQAKVANDQNEVMKRLTMVASLLLLPTFIVGLYGQNFIHMPELRWEHGYLYSWALILGTTAAQLWWFRRNHWI
jgi:magnesium transporter